MLDLKNLSGAVSHENGVSRRLFLGYATALAATPLLGRLAYAQPLERPSFSANPFSLGVASGDPDHQSVVLWTKLAPNPLAADGGMKPGPVEVSWEIAEDESMRSVVQRGVTRASGELGHSVHVEVSGLKPDRWYWYRFRAGDAETVVARTRTLPLAESLPPTLNFAFASCQHYEGGYYTAYEAMAKDDLDLVFHLGDYIYEGAGRRDQPRRHERGMIISLEDYRVRHSQYRSDPALQASHARCPWFVTWDDHEVSNNYANDIDGRPGTSAVDFLKRRAAAYQVYYEMMPLRAASLPSGPDMQLYRKASFGRLAELLVLDTRQYRTDQPNNDRRSPLNAAALDRASTILGSRQKQWLKDSLVGSRGTWNILAQQVMMGMLANRPGTSSTAPATAPAADEHNEYTYSMDAWPGYAHERMEMVQFLHERKVSNPVVLTGDVHANYLNELRVDDRQPDAPVVATEFVGTSITSGGDGVDRAPNHDSLMSDNAGLRFYNRQRGYVRCKVTPGLWTTDYVTVDKVTERGGTASTRASFVVETGRPGVKPA